MSGPSNPPMEFNYETSTWLLRAQNSKVFPLLCFCLISTTTIQVKDSALFKYCALFSLGIFFHPNLFFFFFISLSLKIPFFDQTQSMWCGFQSRSKVMGFRSSLFLPCDVFFFFLLSLHLS